ncbi:MAG: hypothetical protein WA154_07480 [Moraxellaceae bacterium]
MQIRPIYLLTLSMTLLIGCASGVRPYDGVVGFTLIPQQSNHYRYVDEQRHGQAFVVAQLRKGCAEQLGITAEQVQLDQLDVRPLTGRVSQTIQVPTGVAFSGDNFQTDRQTIYGQDNQTRPIALIEARARCGIVAP